MARDKQIQSQVCEFFGRHFVSYAGSYYLLDSNGNPTGKPVGFNYSGFVVSICGRWNLMTAGHILEDLANNLRDNRIIFDREYLVDCYGPNPRTNHPTPFDFEAAPKTFIYRDGLDFGLIGLSDYYVRLLEANGVLPFPAIDWLRQPSDYDFYFLYGLPKELNPVDLERKNLVLNPVMMFVDKLPTRPECAKATDYPRFFGCLRDKDEIQSIDGMSGGPIFGMSRDDEGRDRYWAVGVQSGWWPGQRIIAATPMPVVGRIIAETFQELEEQVLQG